MGFVGNYWKEGHYGMSRSYKVEVEARGICVLDVLRVMTGFMWEELYSCEDRGISYFSGEGCLSGGESEEEAHATVSKALKSLQPKALVKTRWTCLEELPYSEYGDDIEGDE